MAFEMRKSPKNSRAAEATGVVPMPSSPSIRICAEQLYQALQQSPLHFGQGSEDPWQEALWMVSSATGIAYGNLDQHGDDVVDAQALQCVEQWLQQRIRQRRPLAYILQRAWFAGLQFYVDERVLIPRSHLGELLPEQLSPWVCPERISTTLDLCTGSGCIAIALAHYFPHSRVTATDLSVQALAVARINIEHYQLEQRIDLRAGDLFAPLGQQRFDLIVSNPPYVDNSHMTALPREFRQEPWMALAAGDDGLELLIPILQQARKYLHENGVLIVETGAARMALEAKFPNLPFTWLTTTSGEEVIFVLNAKDLPVSQ